MNISESIFSKVEESFKNKQKCLHLSPLSSIKFFYTLSVIRVTMTTSCKQGQQLKICRKSNEGKNTEGKIQTSHFLRKSKMTSKALFMLSANA